MRARLLAGVPLLVLLGACPAPTAVDVGARLFADPRFSDSEFNAFSCATCHAVDEVAAPRIASSMKNVVHRGSWWGGYSPRLIDAASFCNVFFMRGTPLEPSDPRSRALFEYLVSISPDAAATPQTLTVVENVTTLPRGDPRRGEDVWNRSCSVCHGAPGSGLGRISDLVSIVPDASRAFAEEGGFDVELVIIEKVRHGQFFAVGGNMPPFSKEALSDEDLGALIGFLDP